MTASFPYVRIGPKTPHIFGYDGLWLGQDHLLSVHNTRFREDYLRFDLREIQAIVICKQFRFVVPVYWLLASIAVFITAIVATVRGNVLLTNMSWGALVLLALYWLAASTASSCSCHLQTAVGSYELKGLYRSWAAHRVLRTLEARITAVQGAMSDDWTADDSIEPAPASPTPEMPEIAAASLPPAIVPAMACLLLLIDALISWLARTPGRTQALSKLGTIVTLLAIVMPVVAIVVTRRDKRFQNIRVLFLVAVFAVGLANYGNTIAAPFLAAIQTPGQERSLNTVTNVLYWLNQIAEIGLGSLGLLLIFAEARGNTFGRPSSAP